MDDLIRAIGAPLLSAILGGLIVHFAARRRDIENDRRKQRIEYLVSAYQVLVQSAHREFNDERAEAFENAISDVFLLGSDEQISLARELITAFAQDNGAPLDELLMSLRIALRRELGLHPDDLTGTPAIRIVTKPTAQASPLKLKDAAEIRFAEVSATTTKAVLSAALKAAPGLRASDSDSLKFKSEPLSGKVESDPKLAINEAYAAISNQLQDLLSGAGQMPVAQSLHDLAHEAARHDLVSAEFVRTAEGLDILRDLAVNNPRNRTDSQHAQEYLDLASAASYVIASSSAPNGIS